MTNILPNTTMFVFEKAHHVDGWARVTEWEDESPTQKPMFFVVNIVEKDIDQMVHFMNREIKIQEQILVKDMTSKIMHLGQPVRIFNKNNVFKKKTIQTFIQNGV